jgi:hypothetical protein
MDGTSFKDKSRQAAAQRAEYFRAQFQRSGAPDASGAVEKTVRPLSSSRYPIVYNSPTGKSCSAILRYDDFFNYGTAPDYILEGGIQGTGYEGWEMHSSNPQNPSSRLLFNIPFNDGSQPFTYVEAMLRGAPDNGKNTYVVLRDKNCAEHNAGIGCGDELDLVEYYGMTGNHRSEWTVYKPGDYAGNVGHGGYYRDSAQDDPGFYPYSYGVYLEKGNYIQLWERYPNGSWQTLWEQDASHGYVPQNTMYLYAGEWDCSHRDAHGNYDYKPDDWCNPTGVPFAGDSWFALDALEYITCQ